MKKKLGLFQLANFKTVLWGINAVTRIDIYTGNESPNEIKKYITNNKLVFQEIETCPGNPGHICALIISRQRSVLNQYIAARNTGDEVTMRALMGVQFVYPMQKSQLGLIRTIFKNEPGFAIELLVA